ncbi:MAG: hypothetical protein Q4A82_08000 [Corynebacterium sp.]|nr:hypothetical protein [Corynebacterium sp.]
MKPQTSYFIALGAFSASAILTFLGYGIKYLSPALLGLVGIGLGYLTAKGAWRTSSTPQR